MIPEPFIEEIRNSTDLVALISTWVPLKPAGADFQACCPFHDEKTPSFTVSPTKHFYHCFGCGAHGSAIDFLIEHQQLSFPDAVHQLAARLGFTVPETNYDPAARREHTRQQTQAELESALNHELLILLQVIQGRVNSRILANTRPVLPPEYRPYPDSHWQRENLAAKRIQRSLSLLYSGSTT